MNKPLILPEKEILARLPEIPGWSYQDNKIKKEYKFATFMKLIEFVNRLVPFFEKNDHHPDIHIYYKKVVFELQRFDVGGKVTDKDFLVAKKIEDEYQKSAPR